MTHYCAIPPVDMAVGHVGRGYGMGFNRLHTRADQLHGGQDYMVGAGTPIVAPLPGRVVLVSHEDGPGYNRGMTGYGNSVVLQHDTPLPVPTAPLPGQSRAPTRGLPSPFWTSYNHMGAHPLVTVGQTVMPGTLLGHVGNTNNRSFPGMPAHLHVEVRKRMFPSSYDNDTIDPNLLWASLGIDLVGSHQEAERRVGGTLQVRAGGPSDCPTGTQSELRGLYSFRGGLFDAPRSAGQAGAGQQYVSPAALSTKYVAGSVSPTGEDVDPPDYKAVQPERPNLPLILGASVLAAIGFAWWMNRDQKRSGLRGLGYQPNDAECLELEKKLIDLSEKYAHDRDFSVWPKGKKLYTLWQDRCEYEQHTSSLWQSNVHEVFDHPDEASARWSFEQMLRTLQREELEDEDPPPQ